jgi:hypothetical protein
MDSKNKIQPDKIIIIGCINEETVNKINEQFGKDNKVVLLNNEVVIDYVRKQSVEDKDEENKVQEFLTNDTNRMRVKEKALTLWNMLTANQDITNIDKRIFTKIEITKRTNMNLQKATEVLDLFNLFGFISYQKGKYEFKFCFDNKTQLDAVHANILESIGSLNALLLSYKSILNSDKKHSEEDKTTELYDLSSEVKELIKF